MSFTINLTNEKGETLSSLEDLGLLSKFIYKEPNLNKFEQLKYLDAYGDTIFNKNQIEGVINDLKLIKLEISDTKLKDIVSKIQNLANSVLDASHLYLKFYGD